MGYLLLGLFVLSLFAGIMTMQFNHPENGRTGWLGSLLKETGLKQKEQNQKTHSQKILAALRHERLALLDNVQDQQAFLRQAELQRYGFSQMVRELSDSAGVDLLELKNLMQSFDDQNRLLINQGKDLIKFNQEQMRIRQRSLEEASRESVDRGVQAQHFLEEIDRTKELRSDFINRSMANTKALHESNENMRIKLDKLENNMRANALPMTTRVQEVNTRNQDMIEAAKAHEQRLRDFKQQHDAQNKINQEGKKDLLSQQSRAFDDAQERAREQKRLAEERTEDQMQRLRDKRNR